MLICSDCASSSGSSVTKQGTGIPPSVLGRASPALPGWPGREGDPPAHSCQLKGRSRDLRGRCPPSVLHVHSRCHPAPNTYKVSRACRPQTSPAWTLVMHQQSSLCATTTPNTTAVQSALSYEHVLRTTAASWSVPDTAEQAYRAIVPDWGDEQSGHTQRIEVHSGRHLMVSVDSLVESHQLLSTLVIISCTTMTASVQQTFRVRCVGSLCHAVYW